MHWRKVRQFLDREGLAYEVLVHAPAWGAPRIAAALHVPGREVAKTVIVKLDGQLAMAVLPADHALDLEALARETMSHAADLATEWEFKDHFPDCEAGATPPFGNLYGMPVFASHLLARDEHIAFPAGNHCEVIRLAFVDYMRVVRPRLARIAIEAVGRSVRSRRAIRPLATPMPLTVVGLGSAAFGPSNPRQGDPGFAKQSSVPAMGGRISTRSAENPPPPRVSG